MVNFKVSYKSENALKVIGWAAQELNSGTKIDFPAFGCILIRGAKQAYKAQEAKALFG
jgi:hypothetical protein